MTLRRFAQNVPAVVRNARFRLADTRMAYGDAQDATSQHSA